jgi:hypothetical protein
MTQKVINIPSGSLATLTTKGDLLTYDSANQRLPVGTDGYLLTSDSAETTGLKWVPAGGGGVTLETARTGGNVFAGDVDYDGNNIVDIAAVGFELGEQVTWNDNFHTLNVPSGLDSINQVGQEFWFLIYNDTGFQLDAGHVVQPVGGALVGSVILPTVKLAQADTFENCQGTLLVTTSDIPDGTAGMVTRIGRATGFDFSTYTPGADLYLSPTVAGHLTETRPQFPDYEITMGGVLNNVSNGTMAVSITTRVQDTILNAWDGSIRESLDFTVASAGGTITGSLEQTGTGDLTMIFSTGLIILDCTPQKTIVLTAGTDTNPQANYVYIPESTKVLTLSTSGFPTTEHIKIANLLLRSATSTETDDALLNRNWNDHMKTIGNNGHLLHMTERMRQDHASHLSGTEGTCTIASPTSSDVFVDVTGGVIYQLHRHTFGALDSSTGDALHIINHNTTPYVEETNLNTQVLDSAGSTLANKSFSFVLWGVQNKSGEKSHLMINLPSGSYAKNSPDNAVNDASNYSDYTIPESFRGSAFLIARFTYILEANGTDWSLYHTEDLRGHTPNTAAGGGGGGGGGATTYLGLTDTDSSYASQALKVAMVGAGETGLEFMFVDHVNLLNKGTNTHAQLDTHVADATIHFTEGSIDHTAITNIGTNSHAQIDTHIALSSVHFTEGSIDHTAITNIGTNSHTQIDTHLALTNAHLDWEASSVGTIHATNYVDNDTTDHTAFSNIGTNSHTQIDTHLALVNQHLDWSASSVGTIHATNYVDNDTTDHTAFSNIGTNSHAQLDTHVADATIHYVVGAIDHTLILNSGSQTHAQIDTHIGTSSGNPHGVAFDYLPDRDRAAQEATTVASASGGVTFNMAKSVSDVTLTGDITSVAFSTQPDSDQRVSALLNVYQNGTGGYTIDWTGSGVYVEDGDVAADYQPLATALAHTQYWLNWTGTHWVMSLIKISLTAL